MALCSFCIGPTCRTRVSAEGLGGEALSIGAFEGSRWRHALEKEWPALRFGGVKVETAGEQQVFEVDVYLNQLDANAAQVELYADGVNGDGPVRQQMERVRQLAGASGGYAYTARVPAARPAGDYTVRVAPHHDGIAVPLEDAQILSAIRTGLSITSTLPSTPG